MKHFWTKIKRHLKLWIPILFFVSLIVVGAVIWIKKIYPFAMVNGAVVLEREYAGTERILLAYYDKVAQSEKENIIPLDSQKLRRTIVGEVVDRALIREYLHANVEETLLIELESDALAETKSAEFRKAAETFYGSAFGEIGLYVLLPQAERDILRSRLILEDRDFDVWLLEARKGATVRIFSREFRFRDGKAVER